MNPSTAYLANLPKRVRIVEVGPRDGLQNESAIVSTAEKREFIERLSAAGFEEIEVSSFVNPARVPQLADAAELFAQLRTDTSRLRYSALVPNRRGLDRALEAGVRAISLFTAASETFAQKNIGMTIPQSLETFRSLMPDAKGAEMRVRAYVSTAFFCPYEGRILPNQVIPVVEALLEMGADEISIGDTIGYAAPSDVDALTRALLPGLSVEQFAYHFHNTLGRGLANVLMALQHGIQIFDSSAGGVGGCPFAPGAAGNVATEDLVSMLTQMGIETGIDIDKVIYASQLLSEVLGRPLPSRYLQACNRPKSAESV
jgi:hydroxymethylglutaryl-CoA lyase